MWASASAPASVRFDQPTASHRAEAAGPPDIDNRPSYVAWAVAWFIGFGAFAIGGGDDPIIGMPVIVPALLLAVGIVAGIAISIYCVARAVRGITGPAAVSGRLFGASWFIGYAALFLYIAGISNFVGGHVVEKIMWPAGAGVVAGLLYLAGGVLHRDYVQYGLGVWLALTSAGGALLGVDGLHWALATVGAGGYAAAALLEHRHRSAAPAHRR